MVLQEQRSRQQAEAGDGPSGLVTPRHVADGGPRAVQSPASAVEGLVGPTGSEIVLVCWLLLCVSCCRALVVSGH